MRAIIFTALLLLAGRGTNHALALAHPQDLLTPAAPPQLAERALVCSVVCGLLPSSALCNDVCRTCAAPRTFCAETKTCADCGSDGDNCGACGHKCGAGYTCCNSRCVAESAMSGDDDNCGVCGKKCGAGYSCCDSECVPHSAFANDPENCGSCNRKCAAGEQCRERTCVPPPPPDNGNRCRLPAGHSPSDSQSSSLFRTCRAPGSACGKSGGKGGARCDCATDLRGEPFCGESGTGAGCEGARRCGRDGDCWKGEVCGVGVGCCESGVGGRHGGKKGVCVKVCGK